MIYARINESTGELSIQGNLKDIFEEYKHITDQLLQTHFDEFMAAMDKWNEEVKHKMTKQISITIEEDQLAYLDELAKINGRSRSSMLNWLLKMAEASDEAEKEEDD